MIIHFLARNDCQVQVAEPAGALAMEGKNLFYVLCFSSIYSSSMLIKHR